MEGRSLRILALVVVFAAVVGLVGAALLFGVVTLAKPVLTSALARPALAAQTGGDADPDSGLIVTRVDPEGPAAAAGIVRGDILQVVDGIEIATRADLREVLDALETGDSVDLTVLHGDELRTYTVTPELRDDRPYLGLSLCCGQGDLPFGGIIERDLELAFEGALLTTVVPEGPADVAGLQEGDRILAVDGEELGPELNLAEMIGKFAPGDRVTLEAQSPDGEPREVTVTLGEHPEDAGRAYLGVEYRMGLPMRIFPEGDLPEGLPFFEFPFGHGPGRFSFDGEGFQEGLMIREVVEDSPAAEAGLMESDLIIALDGEPVGTPAALAERIGDLAPGTRLELTVLREGEEGERVVPVTLGASPDDESRGYLGVAIGGFFRFHRVGPEGGLEEGFPPFEFDFLPDGEFQFEFPDSVDA